MIREKTHKIDLTDILPKEIRVGIFPEPDRTPVTNAELGYKHEFGDPQARIPPRPWLIPGVSNALAGLEDISDIGGYVSNKVKEYIASSPFLPLSPITIEARKRRGVYSTKPLMDTLQMYNSIGYRVVKK